MYTLPQDQRITIRDVTPSLRKLIAHMTHRWQGDRISVVITPNIDVTYNSGLEAHLINLPDRIIQPSLPELSQERERARTQYSGYIRNSYTGALQDGQSLVIFKQKNWGQMHNADATFYLKSFTDIIDDQGQLDVARDALLTGDHQTATKLTREVLPQSHGLFTALIKREMTMLKTFETWRESKRLSNE